MAFAIAKYSTFDFSLTDPKFRSNVTPLGFDCKDWRLRYKQVRRRLR